MGGYIAADRTIIDCIRSYAPGFIFTTSLSPALAAGALAAIRHLKASCTERQAQQEAAARLKAKFAAAGLPLMPSATPYRAGAGRLSGQGEADQRYLARGVRALCSAHQLPDRASRYRALAVHARSAAHGGDDRRIDERRRRDPGSRRDQARGLIHAAPGPSHARSIWWRNTGESGAHRLGRQHAHCPHRRSCRGRPQG